MRNIHMVPLGSCSFIVCLFKYFLFLKVNQHAQHLYGSTTRLMLLCLVKYSKILKINNMHKIHMALQPDLFDNEDELICLQRVQQGGLQVLQIYFS